MWPSSDSMQLSIIKANTNTPTYTRIFAQAHIVLTILRPRACTSPCTSLHNLVHPHNYAYTLSCMLHDDIILAIWFEMELLLFFVFFCFFLVFFWFFSRSHCCAFLFSTPASKIWPSSKQWLITSSTPTSSIRHITWYGKTIHLFIFSEFTCHLAHAHLNAHSYVPISILIWNVMIEFSSRHV